MSNSSWEQAFSELIYLRAKVDKNALPLIGGRSFFYPISLGIPTSESAELYFFQSVSFLYVLFFEAGSENIKFIRDKLSVYGQNPDSFKDFLRIVQALRTYLQHNLDLTSPRDSYIRDQVHSWFMAKCEFAFPFKLEQWDKSISSLLLDAKNSLQSMIDCIESIKSDESCESICSDWCFRITRHHPPFQFDELLSKIALDMGRNNIDVVKFRSRFYDSWQKKLSQLEPGYDFESEGRKVIEYSLLADNIVTLPITGKDVIDILNITPGQRVGVILSEATRIYKDNPCDKEHILAALSKKIMDGTL